ncbi:MAG: RNA-binding protein [Anaerolineales bacterium]|nr:RNA-binding protein [Anaerolineales bacterium]
MDVKLYVGNLSYDTTVDDVRMLFAQAGALVTVDLIMDRDTGQAKGFGFVTYASEAEAQKAIGMFNGFMLRGRAMKVSVAKPREERTAVPARGGAFGAGYAGGRGGHKRRGGNR